MNRKGKEWSDFVAKQKATIYERLKKYKNVETASNSLKETGDLSYYQFYKSTAVSKYLLQALDKIEEGSYGVCNVCKQEIPIARLEIVPGALSCVGCDGNKKDRK